MGIFGNFFNLLSGKVRTFFAGYSPKTSSPVWAGNLWEHDICRSCIDCIADAAARAEFQHVILDSDGKIKSVKYNSPYVKVLNQRPNQMMSAYDLWYRLFAQRETHTTAIAYVKWKIMGNSVIPDEIIPIDFRTYDFEKTADTGELVIHVRMDDGEEFYLFANDCIVLRKAYMNKLGGGDGNAAIIPLLDMAKASDSGFIESLQVANKVRGVHKHKIAGLNEEDIIADQARFAERFKHAAEGGYLSVDSKEDFVPFAVQSYSATASQMAIISERIYSYFRTPKEIVMGTASSDARQGWHISKIQGIWRALEQSLNNSLFTQRELDMGNRIIISGGGIQNANLEQKLAFVRETFGMGLFPDNFYLELLGQPKSEDGEQKTFNLMYIDKANAAEYQVGTQKKKEDENNE